MHLSVRNNVIRAAVFVFEPIPALRPAHTIVPSTTPGLVYKHKGTIAVDIAATSTGRIQG